MATALSDSPRPCFPTDTKSPLRDEGSYKYRASRVFISILSGTDNPASRYLSLSHNTPHSDFIEERQAMHDILPVIRSYVWGQRRGGAQYPGASAANGYLRIRMTGLCYDTRHLFSIGISPGKKFG